LVVIWDLVLKTCATDGLDLLKVGMPCEEGKEHGAIGQWMELRGSILGRGSACGAV
jgi:hypothetical protein